MNALQQHFDRHPLLVAAALAAAVLLAIYEFIRYHRKQATISPQELIRLQNHGALVLDLRDGEAFSQGHIGGARQFAAGDILDAGAKLGKYKDKPLVVYCDTGGLAGSAVRQLVAQGFKHAFALSGGLGSWRAENLPLTKAS
ncbi:MAG: rhodanese-like domain-containing protein [Steroidobacteraceae bacterium]